MKPRIEQRATSQALEEIQPLRGAGLPVCSKIPKAGEPGWKEGTSGEPQSGVHIDPGTPAKSEYEEAERCDRREELFCPSWLRLSLVSDHPENFRLEQLELRNLRRSPIRPPEDQNRITSLANPKLTGALRIDPPSPLTGTEA